jgi:hypothetical protein
MLFSVLGIRLLVFLVFGGLYVTTNRFANRPRYMREGQDHKAQMFPISCIVLFVAAIAEIIISTSQLGLGAVLLPANILILITGSLLLAQGISWSVNEYNNIQTEKRLRKEDKEHRDPSVAQS